MVDSGHPFALVTRERPTKKCAVGGKLHDFAPSDEERRKEHPSGVLIQHVWVCTKCGERTWWW